MAQAKKKSSAGKYTKPALRERLKSEVMAGSKGGNPGQWSARKAQILAQRYKSAGGGYKGGKSAPQKSLKKWTGEKWTTSDGKPAIRTTKTGEKVTKRYLPKKAWSKLTPAEKKATDAKKVEGSKKGKQVVKNTKKAASAGRSARKTSTSKKATRSKKGSKR